MTSVAAYCQPVHAFCICVHLASSVHVNFNYYHYLCMFLLQLSGPDVYHGVPHDYTNLVCLCSSGVGPIYMLLYILKNNAIVGGIPKVHAHWWAYFATNRNVIHSTGGHFQSIGGHLQSVGRLLQGT